MAKRLICVWLTFTIMLLSPIAAYADSKVEDQEAIFFLKDVVINGVEIVNYNLQYPFFLHKDVTYIPLTKDICNICGMSATLDYNSHTLTIEKKESTQSQLSENWGKNSGVNFMVSRAKGVSVVLQEMEILEDGTERKLVSEEMDLNGFPVLMKSKTIFVPLKLFTESKIFDWDVAYDSYFGTSIVTKQIPKLVSTECEVLDEDGEPVKGEDGKVLTEKKDMIALDGEENPVYMTAADFIDKDKVALRKALCEYIRSVNSGIYPSLSQKYLAFFERAAEVYNTDLILTMALARRESSFTYNLGTGKKAHGIMQILPSTAASYGIAEWQLYDPKINIEFGTMYIADKIKLCGGDYSKALTAYNKGYKAVQRGMTSCAYSQNVLESYNYILGMLNEKGISINE